MIFLKKSVLLFYLFLFFSVNQTLLFPQVIVQDSLALISFFHLSNGESWKNHDNWLTTAPVSKWYGVVVENNRVVGLQFGAGNNLRDSIPSSIGKLTALVEINLNYNFVTYIPEEIGKLSKLKNLFLRSNQIKQLPVSLSALHELEKVDISKNLILVFPDSLEKLAKLNFLDASYNDLVSLPESFASLLRLSSLNLSGNNFVEIPLAITKLKALKELYFSDNPIRNIPVELFTLDSLTILYLNGNMISTIPGEIENLKFIKDLQLSGNQLRSVPVELGNLISLNNLDLSYNLISTFPEEIGYLKNLKSLNAVYNKISVLPNSIGNLSSLEKLKLQHNYLDSLPENIADLKGLSELDLERNFFSDSLPAQIGRLENLNMISFRGNQLKHIKNDLFSRLLKLKWVFLENNFLENLPDFSNNKILADLTVQSNRLTFEDLEPVMKKNNLHFYYSPQDSVAIKADTNLKTDTFITLYVNVGGTKNKYKWMREGVELPNADSQYLQLKASDSAASGKYVCKVLNQDVPDLVLFSKEYRLYPTNVISSVLSSSEIPKQYSLNQNFPNPFNPTTEIRYDIPSEVHVLLKIFSIDGREVRTLVNEVQTPGHKAVVWDGKNNIEQPVSSGIYIYKLQSGNYSFSRKMLMIK